MALFNTASALHAVLAGMIPTKQPVFAQMHRAILIYIYIRGIEGYKRFRHVGFGFATLGGPLKGQHKKGYYIIGGLRGAPKP